MKIKQLLISLSALTLFSCGGGTQNNNNEGAQAQQTADTQGAAESQPMDETVTLPDEVVKFINSLPKQPDKPLYDCLTNYLTDDGHYFDEVYNLYPIKSGGFAIICIRRDDYEENESVFSYIPYIYKDGVAKTAREIMPVPDIGLFINNDKMKGHEAEAKTLVELYNKSPRDYVFYAVNQGELIIHAGIKLNKDNILNLDYNDELYYDLAYNFFLAAYKWDGEKFAYYDMLAEFIKSLPKKADKPVYSFTDEYDIKQEYCANKIDYYALPHKDGGYTALVRYQAQCEATLFWDNFSYVCKDGKITKIENILPVPDVNDLLDADKCKGRDDQVAEIKKQYNSGPHLYLLYSFTETGELHATMEGNGCEQWGESDLELMKDAVYTWNGEKFIK